MKICDVRVTDRLKRGGFIRLKKVAWCYVRLQDDQLWWVDVKTHRRVSIVEAFSEWVSNDWEFYETKEASVSESGSISTQPSLR